MKSKIEQILPKVQKPSRYAGGEYGSIVKDHGKCRVKFAFCFPDSYDVGMSHLGMKILYSLINEREEYCCERVFLPMKDMAEEMRKNNLELFALESFSAVKTFDFVGFTLQYELSYTAVLAMLELSGIPFYASERGEEFPLIIAGGPCACNPAPLKDFFDVFVIGEGEEVTLELLELYDKCKEAGNYSKADFLQKASGIKGVYCPAVNSSGKITKRIIKDLDKVYYPKTFIVPFCEIVHDRAVTEVLRGCIRGCRFCQAGFIYRPFREKSRDTIINTAKDLCSSTGFDEMSLASLSTGDYSGIEQLLLELTEYTDAVRVGLSLPSLRIDNFSKTMLERIKSIRKSGLTFAPEAGTQRLRDVINKNITEEEIFKGCKIAFEGGYTSVKLYFMLGLPTETDADIEGIAGLAIKIINFYYTLPEREKGKAPSVSISLSTFVPKPFTPFEFEPLLCKDEVIRRQKLLLDIIRNSGKAGKKIRVRRSDYGKTFIEAVLARGDDKLCGVLVQSYRNGNISADDFSYSGWEKAFTECNINPHDYVRERSYTEVSAWENIDMLVTKNFLIAEHKKSRNTTEENITTPNCREQCGGCGAGGYVRGICTREIPHI